MAEDGTTTVQARNSILLVAAGAAVVAIGVAVLWLRPPPEPGPSVLVVLWDTVRAGVKLPFALIMAFLYTQTKRGMADRVTDQVEQLLGRPPTSMRQYIEDYADMWRQRG